MLKKSLGLLGASMLLASCTSGNSAIEPPFKSVDVATNKLTFAVGTANFQGLTTGLNTVVSFRQANGSSGSLVNTPTITGPAGFLVPSVSSAGIDAGTSSITGAPQNQQPGGTVTSDTFGQAGGAFSYGFLPLNASNQAVFGNNGYDPYGQPIYPELIPGYTSDPTTTTFFPPVFFGGPPAYTNIRTGTYPSGFSGFSQGFDIFAGTTLATGSYVLSVVIPQSPTTNATVSTTATLASVAALPTYATPTFTGDGAGGATITIQIPAGVTETLVDVVDRGPSPAANPAPTPCHGAYKAPYYYTIVDKTPGPAAVTVTLPGNVGPILPTTGTASPTFCMGDRYRVYAVGTDYLAYESGPGQPASGGLAQVPSFLNGPQSDITISTRASGTY